MCCAERSTEMRVRVGVGGLAAAVAVAAGLLAAPGTAAADPAPVPAVQPDRVLVAVRVDGEGPVTVDTTQLTGPKLRAWWFDGCGRTIDAGSVPRDRAARLDPPDTGDGV